MQLGIWQILAMMSHYVPQAVLVSLVELQTYSLMASGMTYTLQRQTTPVGLLEQSPKRAARFKVVELSWI